MKSFLRIIGIVIILSSCSTSHRKTESYDTGNVYSDRFSIRDFGSYSVLKITNPWQSAEATGFTYVLARDHAQLPDSLVNCTLIRVPVKNIVVFSTTHIGFISALHEENSITGASGLQYIYNGIVRERIDSGLVKETGYAPAVDYETIINLNPGLVLLYGLNSSVTGIAVRLAQAGIPSVIIAEYLENHPLGKMEWIKVFGAFYNKEELAGQLFNSAVKRYLNLSRQAVNAPSKPGVMTGLPWKDTWYMAGGRSFMAKLIEDAGGRYLWADDTSEEFIPLDLETVFMKAFNADTWINAGSARSLGELAARDERFTRLPVFSNRMIYNNDKRLGAGGGNDYWESGVVRPDEILADLVKIFHPGLLPEHNFVYYRKLE